MSIKAVLANLILLLPAILLAVVGALSQGLFWAILAIGVYISFRILDIADMTSEGSFALGGCVSATVIVALGWNPFISLIIAIIAGMLSGVVTGLLHTKLKIPAILSGILSMIALYSVNLRIMGQANTPLLGQKTVISEIKGVLPSAQELGMKDSLLQTLVSIGIGLAFAILVIGFLYWFFGTEIGCTIRATGNNEAMVRAQGSNTDLMKIIGLALGNGLIALSGGLVAQSQGYADVSMGVGAIVVGLASIVIGEVVFHKRRSFAYKLRAIIIGAVIYRIIIAIVLQFGLNTNDLKLLTAVLVAVALSVPVLKKQKVAIRKEVQ
ncbi:ABC transporter permease [Anaerocolumna sedimenticola]|uniref:ABC transporter permease n=1 Tax=Anaerocolumna sedimenticola TaxID=2696063 RepID=A0A6P1TU33_9FIRM|nr:ABC transporter permease [Anaerocolumna sedimenticola]